MADQVPFRRYVAANAVVLAPSYATLLVLHWSGQLDGRPTLIAMAAIAAITILLVQRYLGSLARFAKHIVRELRNPDGSVTFQAKIETRPALKPETTAALRR